MSSESGLSTLSAIFPHLSSSTLTTALESNSGNLDRTIEQLLVPSESREAPQRHESGSSLHNDSASTQQRATQASGFAQHRGTRVALPDDFLRAPGWREAHSGSQLDEDERLALRLQNSAYAQGPSGGRAFRAFGNERQYNHTSSGIGPYIDRRTNNALSPYGPAATNPDEKNPSVTEALSAMGQDMKKGIMGFAARFSGKPVSINDSAASPLMHSRDENDDHTEVITFDTGDNSRRATGRTGSSSIGNFAQGSKKDK